MRHFAEPVATAVYLIKQALERDHDAGENF